RTRHADDLRRGEGETVDGESGGVRHSSFLKCVLSGQKINHNGAQQTAGSQQRHSRYASYLHRC
ncbi:hypothetical protein QN360_18125, partial [Glaciimonas sp. CA11.2]|uniref:hypothetical protein n=1 Tax=Glaciimonas sp. CA11.2 TaxID=3048601 RepID=UPI002B23A773